MFIFPRKTFFTLATLGGFFVQSLVVIFSENSSRSFPSLYCHSSDYRETTKFFKIRGNIVTRANQHKY